jgi:hypothetical protein
MAKAIVHAICSGKRYGGTPDMYLSLHETMDSSKEAIADNRHRILSHHMWFVKRVLQRIHGDFFVVPTTDEGFALAAEIEQKKREIAELQERMRAEKLGRVVSVAQIGEDHILEDYGGKFIPLAIDYVESGEMQLADWMQNGVKGHPPSFEQLAARRKTVRLNLD